MTTHSVKKIILRAIQFFFIILVLYIIGRGIWLNLLKKPVVINNKFDFESREISKAAGINYVHQMWTLGYKEIEKILPWITSLGASASIVDINNDGWQDIYVVSSTYQSNNKLYVNQKDGTFLEQADKFGLGAVNEIGVTFRAIFFDADNDGVKEMLQLTSSCPRLFKMGKDKKYFPTDLLRGKESCVPSVALAIFDYDGDGLLDIIYAGVILPKGDAGLFLPENLVMAENGAPTIVLHNVGNAQFKEEKIISRQEMLLFSLAIGVGDFRGKFKQDLWFATDFHHDQVFLKEKNGYSYDDDSIAHSLSKSGMNAELGYIDHQKAPYVFITHVYVEGYSPGGNSFYHYENNRFEDYSSEFGIKNCGWAWGAKFFDINNDGELDLYVANGFVTLPKEEIAGPNDFWFKYVEGNSSNPFVMRLIDWRPTMKGFNFAGNQKDCLFLSMNGKYVNVSNREDLHIDVDNLDGRSVSLIDFMNDGSQGVFVANQKQRPYLFQIIQKNKNHWLGIKLVGSKSNRDAVGAKVLLYRTGMPLLVRENQPFNGFSSQNDERLHFGLGAYSGEVQLEIYWPSGRIQKSKVSSLDKYVQIFEE